MSVRIAVWAHCWKDEPVEFVVEGGQILSSIRKAFYYVVVISGRIQHFIDEITARSFLIF